MALGATRWQAVRFQVLPAALPTIPYGLHPRAGQGHWRDGAPHSRRSLYVGPFCPNLAFGQVYGAARADIQLDQQAPAGIPGERRGRDNCAAHSPVDNERSCHNTTKHLL